MSQTKKTILVAFTVDAQTNENQFVEGLTHTVMGTENQEDPENLWFLDTDFKNVQLVGLVDTFEDHSA